MNISVVYHPGTKDDFFPTSRKIKGIEKAVVEYSIHIDEASKSEIDEGVIYDTHSKDLVDKVKRLAFSDVIFSSLRSVLRAVDLIQDHDVVIVPTSGTGHGASKTKFRGYSFLNDVAIAVRALKNKGIRKISIIDCDAHHGGGSIEFFTHDRNLQYVCLCEERTEYNNGRMVCIPTNNLSARDYLSVFQEVMSRVKDFKPEVVFWYLGNDTHRREYAGMDLTSDCYRKMAEELIPFASECRIIILIAGGGLQETAYELVKTIFEAVISIG
jgi:acetoin utilization deacetylase AcuC-like enzyme